MIALARSSELHDFLGVPTMLGKSYVEIMHFEASSSNGVSQAQAVFRDSHTMPYDYVVGVVELLLLS